MRTVLQPSRSCHSPFLQSLLFFYFYLPRKFTTTTSNCSQTSHFPHHDSLQTFLLFLHHDILDFIFQPSLFSIYMCPGYGRGRRHGMAWRGWVSCLKWTYSNKIQVFSTGETGGGAGGRWEDEWVMSVSNQTHSRWVSIHTLRSIWRNINTYSVFHV